MTLPAHRAQRAVGQPFGLQAAFHAAFSLFASPQPTRKSQPEWMPQNESFSAI
jgi:hypothetical protein